MAPSSRFPTTLAAPCARPLNGWVHWSSEARGAANGHRSDCVEPAVKQLGSVRVSDMRIAPLVLQTFGRLAGIRSLLEVLDQAIPESEWSENEALKERAEDEKWGFADFDVEQQVLDERFRFWLPRYTAYSVVTLLYAVLETPTCGVSLAGFWNRRVGSRSSRRTATKRSASPNSTRAISTCSSPTWSCRTWTALPWPPRSSTHAQASTSSTCRDTSPTIPKVRC